MNDRSTVHDFQQDSFRIIFPFFFFFFVFLAFDLLFVCISKISTIRATIVYRSNIFLNKVFDDRDLPNTSDTIYSFYSFSRKIPKFPRNYYRCNEGENITRYSWSLETRIAKHRYRGYQYPRIWYTNRKSVERNP